MIITKKHLPRRTVLRGLGATLAKTYFSAEAAIPAALFTFGCMFTGTVLARWWAARLGDDNHRNSPSPKSPAVTTGVNTSTR